MLLCPIFVGAQQHDNIWLFGYSSDPDTSIFGGSVLDFNKQPTDIFYQYREMNFDETNASICDTTGILLFYSNGIYIADASHEPMENGEGLNPGEFADDHQYYGYILAQGVMAIPKPDSDSLYYLFHASRDYPTSQVGHHTPFFYYSLIDMSLNNGLGAVVEKNQVIIDDILNLGRVTATKHSNGRDWWILLRKYNSNKYYRLLVTPDEILNLGVQEIGEPFNNGVGQSVFSPDGSKYVVYNGNYIWEGGLLNIYDFDRCSGLLSDPIQAANIDSAYTLGAAISTNSRYLYLSSFNYIYQYDLEANDILGSKDTVAVYDGYELEIAPTIGIPTRFSLMQLAPDGKIYISIPGGVNVLHVINNPNEAGVACDVAQHSVILPTYNSRTMPNFPNYRLGAEIGSPCDTITSTHLPDIPTLHVKVFPNPASDYIKVLLESRTNEKIDFLIYNDIGQLVLADQVSGTGNVTEIDVSHLLPGIYFYKCDLDGRTFNGKIILIK